MAADARYASVSEIGDIEGQLESYVSRILRLSLLAPDNCGAILGERTEQALMLERVERVQYRRPGRSSENKCSVNVERPCERVGAPLTGNIA
jgi:hypothetical protein